MSAGLAAILGFVAGFVAGSSVVLVVGAALVAGARRP